MDLKPGDRAVVVKPEPGAHSAVMAPYVGRTLTFERFDKGPGDTFHAYFQETGEVPFTIGWLQPHVGGRYIYGYDPIIFDMSDKMAVKLRAAQERSKLYKDFHFEVTREDRQVGTTRFPVNSVEAMPNPWPKLFEKATTLYTEPGALLPGEIFVIMAKSKNMKGTFTGRLSSGDIANTPKDKKPSLKEVVAKKLGTDMTTWDEVREQAERLKKLSADLEVPIITATQKPATDKSDTCDCSSKDLLWVGHKCGRAKRNGNK